MLLTSKEFSDKYCVSKTVWLPFLRSIGIEAKAEKRIKSYPQITIEQRRWILGGLLGDGGVSRDLRYYESHALKQELYLRKSIIS
jgi:hypothetical protein